MSRFFYFIVTFVVLSSSGSSSFGLQRIGCKKPREADPSYHPWSDWLAGADAHQDLPASLCAAAACWGPQHSASAAPARDPLPHLYRDRKGGGQKRGSIRNLFPLNNQNEKKNGRIISFISFSLPVPGSCKTDRDFCSSARLPQAVAGPC